MQSWLVDSRHNKQSIGKTEENLAHIEDLDEKKKKNITCMELYISLHYFQSQ